MEFQELVKGNRIRVQTKSGKNLEVMDRQEYTESDLHVKQQAQEDSIPLASSAHWSNVTIHKKTKKRVYKFWKTPTNGKCPFEGNDREEQQYHVELNKKNYPLIPMEVASYIKAISIDEQYIFKEQRIVNDS